MKVNPPSDSTGENNSFVSIFKPVPGSDEGTYEEEELLNAGEVAISLPGSDSPTEIETTAEEQSTWLFIFWSRNPDEIEPYQKKFPKLEFMMKYGYAMAKYTGKDDLADLMRTYFINPKDLQEFTLSQEICEVLGIVVGGDQKMMGTFLKPEIDGEDKFRSYLLEKHFYRYKAGTPALLFLPWQIAAIMDGIPTDAARGSAGENSRGYGNRKVTCLGMYPTQSLKIPKILKDPKKKYDFSEHSVEERSVLKNRYSDEFASLALKRGKAYASLSVACLEQVFSCKLDHVEVETGETLGSMSNEYTFNYLEDIYGKSMEYVRTIFKEKEGELADVADSYGELARVFLTADDGGANTYWADGRSSHPAAILSAFLTSGESRVSLNVDNEVETVRGACKNVQDWEKVPSESFAIHNYILSRREEAEKKLKVFKRVRVRAFDRQPPWSNAENFRPHNTPSNIGFESTDDRKRKYLGRPLWEEFMPYRDGDPLASHEDTLKLFRRCLLGIASEDDYENIKAYLVEKGECFLRMTHWWFMRRATDIPSTTKKPTVPPNFEELKKRVAEDFIEDLKRVSLISLISADKGGVEMPRELFVALLLNRRKRARGMNVTQKVDHFKKETIGFSGMIRHDGKLFYPHILSQVVVDNLGQIKLPHYSPEFRGGMTVDNFRPCTWNDCKKALLKMATLRVLEIIKSENKKNDSFLSMANKFLESEQDRSQGGFKQKEYVPGDVEKLNFIRPKYKDSRGKDTNDVSKIHRATLEREQTSDQELYTFGEFSFLVHKKKDKEYHFEHVTHPLGELVLGGSHLLGAERPLPTLLAPFRGTEVPFKKNTSPEIKPLTEWDKDNSFKAPKPNATSKFSKGKKKKEPTEGFVEKERDSNLGTPFSFQGTLPSLSTKRLYSVPKATGMSDNEFGRTETMMFDPTGNDTMGNADGQSITGETFGDFHLDRVSFGVQDILGNPSNIGCSPYVMAKGYKLDTRVGSFAGRAQTIKSLTNEICQRLYPCVHGKLRGLAASAFRNERLRDNQLPDNLAEARTVMEDLASQISLFLERIVSNSQSLHQSQNHRVWRESRYVDRDLDPLEHGTTMPCRVVTFTRFSDSTDETGEEEMSGPMIPRVGALVSTPLGFIICEPRSKGFYHVLEDTPWSSRTFLGAEQSPRSLGAHSFFAVHCQYHMSGCDGLVSDEIYPPEHTLEINFYEKKPKDQETFGPFGHGHIQYHLAMIRSRPDLFFDRLCKNMNIMPDWIGQTHMKYFGGELVPWSPRFRIKYGQKMPVTPYFLFSSPFVFRNVLRERTIGAGTSAIVPPNYSGLSDAVQYVQKMPYGSVFLDEYYIERLCGESMRCRFPQETNKGAFLWKVSKMQISSLIEANGSRLEIPTRNWVVKAEQLMNLNPFGFALDKNIEKVESLNLYLSRATLMTMLLSGMQATFTEKKDKIDLFSNMFIFLLDNAIGEGTNEKSAYYDTFFNFFKIIRAQLSQKMSPCDIFKLGQAFSRISDYRNTKDVSPFYFPFSTPYRVPNERGNGDISRCFEFLSDTRFLKGIVKELFTKQNAENSWFQQLEGGNFNPPYIEPEDKQITVDEDETPGITFEEGTELRGGMGVYARAGSIPSFKGDTLELLGGISVFFDSLELKGGANTSGEVLESGSDYNMEAGDDSPRETSEYTAKKSSAAKRKKRKAKMAKKTKKMIRYCRDLLDLKKEADKAAEPDYDGETTRDQVGDYGANRKPRPAQYAAALDQSLGKLDTSSSDDEDDDDDSYLVEYERDRREMEEEDEALLKRLEDDPEVTIFNESSDDDTNPARSARQDEEMDMDDNYVDERAIERYRREKDVYSGQYDDDDDAMDTYMSISAAVDSLFDATAIGDCVDAIF